MGRETAYEIAVSNGPRSDSSRQTGYFSQPRASSDPQTYRPVPGAAGSFTIAAGATVYVGVSPEGGAWSVNEIEVTVAGGGSSSGATASSSSSSSGTTMTSTASSSSGGASTSGGSTPGKLLGMNCSFGDLPAAQTSVLNELGVNSVRGDIELSGSAFGDPSYDGTTANWINTLTSYGIVPLPLLNQYVEISTLDIDAFVQATVAWCQAYCAGGSFYSGNASADATYAPQVLEILNEPYGNWWGYPVTTADIDAYGTLLQSLRSALDSAGLTNIAILAAANDNWTGTQNWDSELLSNGGFAAAQGVTVHPYGDVDLSADTSGTDTQGWGLVYYVHTLLDGAGIAAGDAVYATEDGWCTGTGGDCAPAGTSYTEAQKDANIATVINQLATVSWLRGFWYFNLHPYGGNSFGLYDASGNPTPAWSAFQTAAEANGF